MSLGKVRVCHGRESRETWEGSQHLYMNQMLLLQRPAQESPWGLPRVGPLLSPPCSPLPPSPEPQITSPPYDT